MSNFAWRVEYPCGNGPYASGGCQEENMCEIAEVNWGNHPHSDAMSNAHCDSDHPVPQNDCMPLFNESHICGLIDFTALELWFDGWLEELHDMGFVANKYRINDPYPSEFLYGGGLQVAFNRDVATVVETRELVSC